MRSKLLFATLGVLAIGLAATADTAVQATPPQLFTVSGDTVYTTSAPANDTTAISSLSDATLFLEQNSVVVTAPIKYKAYDGSLVATSAGATTSPTQITLTPGEVLDSAMLDSFHTNGGTTNYAGSVTLNVGTIIGLVYQSKDLDTTDTIYGNSDTTYDSGDGSRGLEASGNNFDNFSLSGNTLTYSFNTGGSPDEIRILYTTPEPSPAIAIAIGFSGLIGLMFMKRRTAAS